MDIQYPTQWYHSRANVIWANGPNTFSPRYSNFVRQSPIRKENLKQSGMVVIDNY